MDDLRSARYLEKDIISYDIEADLKLYGEPYKQNANSFILLNCPFCGKVEHLYIKKQYKYYRCFSCNAKGSIYKIVSVLRDISAKEAFRIVHRLIQEPTHYDVDLQLDLLETDYTTDDRLVNIDLPINFVKVNSLPESNDAKIYLKEVRGLTDDMINYFDLRYDEEDERVIFPVYFEDKVVGYQARDITGFATPKIMSSSGFPRNKILYNYNSLIYNIPKVTIIVEGPIDCIKSYKYFSVALFGKFMSPYQMNLLLNIDSLKKVYIGIDPEEEATRISMMKELSAFWDTYMLEIEEGRDLGDCSEKEVEELVNNAKHCSKYIEKVVI